MVVSATPLSPSGNKKGNNRIKVLSMGWGRISPGKKHKNHKHNVL